MSLNEQSNQELSDVITPSIVSNSCRRLRKKLIIMSGMPLTS